MVNENPSVGCRVFQYRSLAPANSDSLTGCRGTGLPGHLNYTVRKTKAVCRPSGKGGLIGSPPFKNTGGDRYRPSWRRAKPKAPRSPVPINSMELGSGETTVKSVMPM